MSECTGPQTLGVPDAFRIGWTGRNIPGSELKIDQPNAEGHGEICYRGRHIFMGYMRDTKATAETIDEEGIFYLFFYFLFYFFYFLFIFFVFVYFLFIFLCFLFFFFLFILISLLLFYYL